MNSQKVVRSILAVLAAAFFLYWGIFFVGWADTGGASGWQAVSAISGALAYAFLLGVAAVLAFRWILGWRPLSWWISLALILPVVTAISVAI